MSAAHHGYGRCVCAYEEHSKPSLGAIEPDHGTAAPPERPSRASPSIVSPRDRLDAGQLCIVRIRLPALTFSHPLRPRPPPSNSRRSRAQDRARCVRRVYESDRRHRHVLGESRALGRRTSRSDGVQTRASWDVDPSNGPRETEECPHETNVPRNACSLMRVIFSSSRPIAPPSSVGARRAGDEAAEGVEHHERGPHEDQGKALRG